MNTEFVQLVDLKDRPIGIMEKLEAHRKAELHRAISIFIFNSNGELLLQRRAANKYHSGNLWTNTCCSHPRPNESNTDAAVRRLKEEMGMYCPLQHQFSFTYMANLDNELSEHEFDHVFFGHSDAEPILNHDEASEWQYLSLDKTRSLILQNPSEFTEWFKIIFEKVNNYRQ